MSSFSIGQMNQFGDALEALGGNTKHLTRLGQSPAILENLLKVLDGKAMFNLNGLAESVVTAFERNQRAAGEVESRNVQARRDMGMLGRRRQHPMETQDTPSGEQIFTDDLIARAYPEYFHSRAGR